MPAQLVPDSIHQSLPEVCLKRSLSARFERLNPLKRLEQGLLDKVLRIRSVADLAREASPGPSPQWREVAREERLKGSSIAGAHALEQAKRGL